MGVIKIFRVYRDPQPSGKAYLVERLWPRGVRHVDVEVHGWLNNVAPSTELDAHPQSWPPLVDAAVAGDVTLLYSSRDREHNNVIAQRDYLRTRTTAKRIG